jgi:cysteine-rich repeat protein
VDFDGNGFLLAVSESSLDVIRVEVDAYDPLDELANQERVAAGGTLTDTRGIAVDENGLVILTDEGNQTVVRLDPDAFDPLDPGSNQTILTSGPPMVEPRGADVVGLGSCGNGMLDPGEQCDDASEFDGDCCSAVCQYESPGSVCAIDACNEGGTCDDVGVCEGTMPVACD